MPSHRTTRYSVVCLCAASVVLSHAQQPPPSREAADRILALDPRWTVSFESAPAAPAGFDQEAAYMPLKGGELVAIGLDEGRVRWEVPLATAVTPATGDGLVFAGAGAEIVALEQRSGTVMWRTTLPASLASPAYFDAGWVLTSIDSGELLALRAQDGHLLWRTQVGAPLAVRPSVSGERIYAALRDHRVVALELGDGALVWTTPLSDEITGLLALEEQVLAGTRANRLHSLAPDNGRIRWTQRAGGDVVGAPIVDADRIYFVAYDNVLRALNRGNGNMLWSRNLPSRPSGGPLRADDVVLVPLSTTDIRAYLATTGAPSFTIQALGELDGAPFMRERVRPTAPRLVAMSRDVSRGPSLQGFAERFEQPPIALPALPGAPAAR